jgi:hypothetical protein
VRTIAAIPAIGASQAPQSYLVPTLHPLLIFFAAWFSVSAGFLARACRSVHGFVSAVGATFFVGGLVLGVLAWHDAWRPSLRLAFEALARDARGRAILEGRHPPVDDEAFAIVTGALRSDASPGDSGASISVDVDELSDPSCPSSPSRPSCP